MIKHFWFADPHFDHGNIIRYSQRLDFLNPQELELYNSRQEFRPSRETIERMNSIIIDNINADVGEDDVLWCIGDWCFNRNYRDACAVLRSRIKCKTIHMVWGNHDAPSEIADLFATHHTCVMVSIREDGQYYFADGLNDHVWFDATTGEHSSKPRGQKIIMSHTAFAVWPSSHKLAWNLYGHSHTSVEPWMDRTLPNRLSIDVGVDNAKRLLGKYRPFSMDDLKFIFKNRRGCAIDHHQNMLTN